MRMNLAYTIPDPNIGTEVSSGKKENELPFKKKKKINKVQISTNLRFAYV